MSGFAGPSADVADRHHIPPRADGVAQVRYWALEQIDAALDWLFPPTCVHCKRKGTFWCLACQQQIEPAPIPNTADVLDGLSDRRATAVFGGSIQSAIHALKYKQNRRLTGAMAVRLAKTFHSTGWKPTLLTAVSLHPERLRERGYNQSALLAARLSAMIRVPFSAEAIRRIKATRPQVGLGYQDRQMNVAGAFSADRTLAAGQSIVVIDDVYTTGATLSACAEALRAAGAQHVWALTVASAAYRGREGDA